MSAAFQIGRIAGIPIRLHITFLAIIPIVAYIFSTFTATTPLEVLGRVYDLSYGFAAVEPPEVRMAYSFAFAILLFLCVALHELGHSFVAMRYGIKIRSITLYIFGGVASMEDIPRDPSMEARMAVAGPGVSGILGAGTILLSLQAASLLGGGHPLTTLLWTLGVINIILMIFNLLPAFPMDGGRVLRAWFASRLPYVEATRRAATIGKFFAVIMGFLGLFGGGILLVVIAIFIYIAANDEEKATAIVVPLEGVKVRDIMSRDLRTVSPDTTVPEIMNLMFREKHRGYPVMEGGRLAGIVTISDVQKVPEERRGTTVVGDVMVRAIYVIEPNADAAEAMKKMMEQQIRRLPVMEDGELVGIVSRSDLLRAIEICTGW
ncbi:CBS domain-containing protein [Methanothrix harundinacea]|uniref:Zinc metalloprotease n=1 Tax=Methanothrix harundinacea (strain 6Ac) TaxID=1110509 RepID=G7WJX8_METH6|nr:CBS domain-containing protein [Methanothrix harundinacea]AET63419.1 CBS domain containing protein [Methanothrix harundinacea 6Ac]